MANIVKRKKALSVSPLKASQPVGGSLATLGFNAAMPMLHGSQGCTAFAKVFFVRHFREPVPLQTTAMDQASSVLGADDNVVEGIKNIAEKNNPALITVLTTGLAETQGCDVKRNVKEFRAKYPQFEHVAVVAVNTPDFTGCVESGYALTIEAILEDLVPDAATAGTKPGMRQRQVNLLCSSMLTPGDIEVLSELFEQFELRPVFIPNIANSLDGALTEDEFSPVTIGGTLVSEMETLGESIATIAIGPSMYRSGEILETKTGVPTYQIPHLYGLQANDQLISLLAEISERPVSERIERQRMQLQDAMLDTHFMLGQIRVAMAADGDQMLAFTDLLQGMGSEVVAAVTPSKAPSLAMLPIEEVKIGDLEDLENLAREAKAQLLIGNSHAVDTAERLGVPIIRAGFPQYDIIGGYTRAWIGYRATRQLLFDIGNLVINFAHEDIPVYHSVYDQKPPSEKEAVAS